MLCRGLASMHVCSTLQVVIAACCWRLSQGSWPLQCSGTQLLAATHATSVTACTVAHSLEATHWNSRLPCASCQQRRSKQSHAAEQQTQTEGSIQGPSARSHLQSGHKGAKEHVCRWLDRSCRDRLCSRAAPSALLLYTSLWFVIACVPQWFLCSCVLLMAAAFQQHLLSLGMCSKGMQARPGPGTA